MPYKPKERELQVLLAADPTTRVTYAIRRFADTGKLVGLIGRDTVIVDSDGLSDYVSLWPHRLFAERLKDLYAPESVAIEYSARSLRQLFEEAPELAGVSLFPTESRSGVLMPLEELFARLRYERSRFGS